MNPWRPIADPMMQRRLGKTAEELAELLCVIARIGIQGIDEIDPASGKTNRQRLHEETADVLAQINCNCRAFDMPRDVIGARVRLKEAMMAEWEGILAAEHAP